MAKRGPKKIPAIIKDKRNTLIKSRHLDDEPEIEAIVIAPKPPKILTGIAVEEWKRITTSLLKMGLLADTDLSTLAIYCNELAVYHSAEAKLRKDQRQQKLYTDLDTLKSITPSVYHKIKMDALSVILKIGAEFGFSPSARTTISATATPTKPASKSNSKKTTAALIKSKRTG